MGGAFSAKSSCAYMDVPNAVGFGAGFSLGITATRGPAVLPGRSDDEADAKGAEELLTGLWPGFAALAIASVFRSTMDPGKALPSCLD